MKGKFDYFTNVEAERRLLVNKFWFGQKRSRAKVTGAKAAHLDKLYRYVLRSR